MPALLQKLTLAHTITYCTCNFPRSVDPTVHYRMLKGPPLCTTLSHITQATCLLQTANEPRITFRIQRNYISDQMSNRRHQVSFFFFFFFRRISWHIFKTVRKISPGADRQWDKHSLSASGCSGMLLQVRWTARDVNGEEDCVGFCLQSCCSPHSAMGSFVPCTSSKKTLFWGRKKLKCFILEDEKGELFNNALIVQTIVSNGGMI